MQALSSRTQRGPFRWKAIALAWLLPACTCGAVQPTSFVTTKVRIYTPHLRAFARVVPVVIAHLRAARTGDVADLDVAPGSRVKIGQRLARLRGPEIDALLQRRQADAASARTALDAATRTLDAVQREFSSRLATRQALLQAETIVADDRARLRTAVADLHAARRLATLRAPATGAVLRVSAANGERVTAGESVLTVLPDRPLWLRAVYYGAQARGALHVGMTGRFTPSDGAPAVPVTVTRIVPRMNDDGGMPVALAPSSGRNATSWISGEAGTVVLDDAPRKGILVPTRALVLDRGRWWVLVRVGHREQPRAVVPGPSAGSLTLIKQGLSPGARIIVVDAYMHFHRDFARDYQVQD